MLLVDPRNRAIAAVHSGWRGTVAGIGVNALNQMQENYKTNPIEVVAAIGPGIGVCCYEVGPEVASQFGLVGRAHLNLADAKRTQLMAAGVPASQIEVLPYCTKCRPDLFHSFRRDHVAAGRMISFIRKVY